MKLSVLLFLSLFYGYPSLAQAKDPAAYFGGSGNEGYVAWLRGVSYDKTVFLPSTNDDAKGVALHWTIEGETIKLAVAAKATGWVAFGLGESGSMLGADMVLYTAASNALVDSYVLEQTIMPFRDECQSWKLIESTVKDEFIIFEASRLLDTGDTQDRVISDDPNDLLPATRVLAAWGDSTAVSYHGDSNARGVIHFQGNSSASDELESFQTTMENEAEGSFDIRATNFTIPTDRTTYVDFCLSRDDILAMNVNLDQDLHIIGFEPIVNPRNKAHVHHFGLIGSGLPFNSSLSCKEFPGIEGAYGWAPGEVPLNLPSNVGSPLGSNGFQSFSMQVHYDNPDGVSGMIDDSGVRMYYTSKKRQYDMGYFVNSDNGALQGSLASPNGGLSEHVLDCPSSCSSSYVTEPLTAFREQLHMHASGASMVNVQIRNGEVIRQGQVEYWDFRQQGNYAIPQESFTILPGDSFRTVCNYNALNNETWGDGSENEMCISTIYYYPRQVFKSEFGDVAFSCGIGMGAILPACEASYETAPFQEERQLGRVFGTPSTTCGAANVTSKPTSSAMDLSMGYIPATLVIAVSGILTLW
jgi:Copper type II ascorbate-dependent monooxygenase, N-terminal domain/DOMON domain/Copper type II ascorbate-dependent monooxygenase, C-terminal domain